MLVTGGEGALLVGSCRGVTAEMPAPAAALSMSAWGPCQQQAERLHAPILRLNVRQSWREEGTKSNFLQSAGN